MLNFKTVKQYVAEQSEDKEFVAALGQVRLETELALARSRTDKSASKRRLTKA